MSADFEAVTRIFDAARRVEGDERGALLERECAGDAALRAEVDALLAHADGTPALSETALDASRRRLDRIAEGEAPELAPGLPRTIGPFEVVRRIGAGGMGVVFEALQRNPERRVAVKVLHATRVSPAMRRRFEREAEILARLQHPGIAQVYATGTCDLGPGEQPYFALELIDGESLTAWAGRHALDLRARLELVVAICDAVHHAHTQGVVHRDLKPDNILVDAGGRARVVDFGIAHAIDAGSAPTLRTTPGELLGTLAYMAPEQVRGEDAARLPTVDVYALGAVAYELVAGRLPRDVTGRALPDAVRAIEHEPIATLAEVAPQVPRDVSSILSKALADVPERRYGSTLALGDDLRRFLDGRPVHARPDSRLYRLERFARRNRATVASLSIVFVALTAALTVSLERTRAARHARAASERAAAEARAINEYLLERMLSAFGPLGLGQDLRVRDALDAAVPQIDEAFAGSPELGAAVRRTAGRSYAELGLNREALHELERAHADLAALHGPSDPATLRALIDLVRVQTNLSEFDAARPLVEAGLAALESLDADALERIEIAVEMRSRVAGVLLRTGDPERALGLASAALADAEAAFGESEITLRALQALAYLRGATGDLEQAEALQRRSIALVEALFGPNDARRIALLDELARTRMRRGFEDEACDLIRDAAALARTHYGDRHPTTLAILASCAGLLGDAGRLDEAMEAQDETLAAYASLLGPDHRHTLRVRSNGVILLRSARQYERAVEEARATLERRRATLAPDDADLANGWDVLGATLMVAGELDEAQAALEQALEVARAAHGEVAPGVADVLYNLATCRSRRGDQEGAAEDYERLAAVDAELYGPEAPFTLSDRYQAAFARLRIGQTERATAELERLVEIQARVLPETSIDALRTLQVLGKAYLAQARFDDAEALLERALAGYRDDPAGRGPREIESMNLVEDFEALYRATGREPSLAAAHVAGD